MPRDRVNIYSTPSKILRKISTSLNNGLLDSEGEGEGGMIWENDILTCILSCKN